MTHGEATSPRTQESCRDGAKDEGWDQKDESGSNARPPQGGESFAGAARGEEGGTEPCPPGHPWIACLGCKKPPPFPKTQPPLSHFEQDSPVHQIS